MAVNIRDVLLVESDGAAANEDLIATRPWLVYDAHGVCSADGDNGNVTTLQRGVGGVFVALSSALDTANGGGLLTRTASLTLAQQNFAPTDVLRWAATGGDTLGRLLGYARIIPRPIAGA